MTDHDRKAARREIADALLKALERRHEVLDLIVEADNKSEAVEAIAGLLGTSHTGAEAVFGLSFDRLTKDSRKIIQAELEDLNKQLSFTLDHPGRARRLEQAAELHPGRASGKLGGLPRTPAVLRE
jgi:DNA gyrase/topoisomerase IV subunit A